MRVGREDGTPVGPVWATMTPDEAWQVLESLVYFFCDDEPGPILDMVRARLQINPEGTHFHLGAGDELTIEVEGAAPST